MPSRLPLFCLCAWLGAGTPKHRRGALCFYGVWAGPAAPYPLPGEEPHPALIVRPAPDPARDARVAARRADDARRAGRALDRFVADLYELVTADPDLHESAHALFGRDSTE